MPNISVISKESHQVLENVSSNKVGLNENSVVVVQVSKDDVASITRENNNALINLRNGEVIVVENYFNAEFADNSLVFQDESGQLYWVKFTNTDGTIAETILYYPIEEIEPLLYSDNFIGGILPWLAGAGVAGIAAAAGGGSDGGDSTPPAPTVNALPAPTVLDDLEPKIGVVANGESTNDTAPTIAGSGAQPGATIKVYDGDQLLGETVAKEDGTWEFVPTTPLAEGPHSLTVTQTVNGQESPKSPVSDFTVDTQPPVVSIDPPADTNDTTPELTGKTELGSTVTVVVKDATGNVVATGPATVNPDGTWSFTPTTELPEGEYTVDATAKDPAGNEQAALPEQLVVDTTPPDISIDPPVDTNDTTPEISGQAEPGSTVDVVVKDKDGNPVAEGPATVNPDGTWSFTPTTELPEGEYTVDATATDPNGNTDIAAPEALVIDTTPPVITIDPPVSTNDTTPELTGKTEPGSTVDVVVKDKDGNPVAQGPATVNPDGTWSFTPTTELPEGEYTVEVTAKDPAGNEVTKEVDGLEIDTTPPIITIDPPVNGDDDDWDNTESSTFTAKFSALSIQSDAVQEKLLKTETNVIFHIKNPAYVFTGTTNQDVVKVDLEIKDKDGNTIAKGPATTFDLTTDKWTYNSGVKLADGDYTLIAYGVDSAKNQTTDVIQFIVDTVAPPVEVQDFGLTNDSTPTFTGTTEAGIQMVRITVKNEAGVVVENATIKPNADGTWSFTPKNLADGKYTVEAIARDLAGNVTPVPDIAGVIVDTTPPPVAIDPVDPTNDTTPEIKGTTEPGATVDVVIKDANGNPVAEGPATVNPDGTWSFTPTTELPEGNYTVEATAKDRAGNQATVDAPVDLVIDTSIPTDVTINAIDLTNDATPEITGTTEPGTTVVVTVIDANGKEVSGPATVNSDGTWSFTPSENLAEGPQQVVAVATDEVGNTAQATEDFVVDTVAPVVTIDPVDPTNDTTPEIKGTTELGATVDVVIKDANGNPVAQGPATVNPDGTWSFTPTTELPEGNYTVEATAKDRASNQATVDAPVDLVIDTSIPTDVTINAIDLTNDATPEITGTTEPGTTVVVTVTDANGKEVSGPATVNPDGTWSFTPSENLAEGPQQVVAVATDEVGNTAQATEDFVVDTVAPVVTIDPVDPTNDTTPEIKGTTEPGATVDVVIKDANGNPVAQGPATVNPDGTWSFTPTTELPEGNYTVEATAKDPAGNQATVDAPIDFVVDTTGPEVTIDPLDITSDATPEIKGKTEPDATVDVVIKDANGNPVAQGPATVNPDGTWSFTPTADLPEGEYTVEATAKDPAGNTGSANEDFTVDVDGPVVTIDPIDSTKDTTPEITGTTEPGATVDVVIKDANGNPVAQGPATVNPDGTWSFTPTTELPEGDYIVEAVGKDPLGNKGEPVTEDFDVDTTAPVGVSINPLNDTNDNTPTITGKTEPGTSVVVTVTDVNGKVVSGAATVNSDGTWTYTPESLADGKQDVVAVATDAAGNTAQATEDFIVDTIGPVIDVYPVSLTDEINDKTPEFTGKTEPGAKVDLTITHVPSGSVMTATVYADADGNFKYVPFFEAPEGDYNVTGVATDKLGNKGAPDSEEFRVDITPPTNVSINPTNDTNDVTPEITGTTEIGSSVEVTVTDSQGKVVKGPATVNPDGTWTFTPSEDLAEGKQSVVAVAKDKAGNTANATDEFIVDFGGPDITIDPIDETNDTTPTISGKTEPGTTVDVVIKDKDGNTVAQGPATVSPDGTWAFTPATPLPEGEYAVEAVAKDKLGNTSEAIEAFEVDTTAPVVTIDPIDATNDTTPQVTGKSEPDATVDVVIKDKDGNPVAQGPATVNPDGTWSFTPTTPLPEGDYTVEATAKDPAGNAAPAAPEALVIDTTPPVVTIDPPVDTNDTTPEIKGTTEPGATVDVVVKDKDGNPVAQGPATVNPDGTWSFTPTTELPEGEYTVEATAKDPVGNEVTVEAPVEFVIDTTDPTNVTIDPIDLTNDATPEITGTTEPGTAVVVSVTDANGKVVSGPATVNPDDTWTFTPSENLAEGEQKVVAVATDKAGNTADATEDFLVDFSGPAISIDPIDATNDTTPELTGTTEPGSSVDVVIKDKDGKPVAQGPATVNPDGSWTFTPTTPLPEGEYAVEAVAKDKQGNASNPAVEAFEVDTTPPVITIDPPADTNDTTPELSGKAEPDSTVDVVVKDKDGNPVAQGPATVNPDGSWTFTPTTPLPEGEYAVEAVAKDKQGNASNPAVEAFEVDTTPPVITIDPPADTNDTTPELSGKAEPDSTVDVVVKDKDGNPVAQGPATVNPDGTWSFTPTTPLPEGEYTVEATAKDPAGNETAATPEALVVDTTPPVITIDPPVDTNDTTPELTGQVEPGSTVDVVVKDKDGNPVATGPATVNPDGSWTFTPTTPLPEGEYTVEATAKDPAGNETAATPEALVVDTTPPVITIDPPVDTNDTTPELTGQAEPGSTVDVVIKDKDGDPVATGPATVNPDGSWTYTPVTPLPEGEYTVEATAKDPAGNETAATPEALVVDTTPPVITIDPPVDTNDTTPELTGQVEPGSTVEVVVKDKDGNPVVTGPAAVNPDGTWSFTPTTPLPEGEYTVEATAKDPAGNETVAAPEALVVDTTPPIITIDPPVDTNDTTPELTGQAEPGSTVDVVIKDKDGNPVATGPATVNPDGSWTYTPVTPLPEGEYTVDATGKDPAGNEQPSQPVELVVDTTPPQITIDPIGDSQTNATNNQQQPITGTGEPGTTVTLSIVGTKVGYKEEGVNVTVDTDGKWSYVPAQKLPEDIYVITGVPSDVAGNVGTTKTENFEVDTTPPIITIDPPVDGDVDDWWNTFSDQPSAVASDEPAVAFAAPMMSRMAFSAPLVEEKTTAQIDSVLLNALSPVTAVVSEVVTAVASEVNYFLNTKQPTFSGQLIGEAVSIDVVIVRDANGNLIETGSALIEGKRWTYKTQNVLEDAIYKIEVVGKDASGNDSNRVGLVFEIDTVIPTVEIFDTAATDDVTPTILGTTSEPNATVTLVISKDGVLVDKGTAIVDSTTGNWSYTTNVDLTDGSYKVDALAKDKAGNSAKDTNTVTVDIIAPDAPIGSFNDDGSVLDGIAQAGSLVTYTGPNGEILTTQADQATGAFKFEFSPAIDQGQTVTLTATDVGGTSAPTTVYAPYVSRNDAVDDVAQAFIDYDHPVTERFIDNAISYSWKFGVLGIVLGRDSGSTTFNVGAGKHADIELQIKTGSLKAIFDQVNIVLSKYNTTTGGWDKVASNTDSGIFDFLGFFGEKATVKVNDLAEGQYRVDMESWSAITKFGYVETDIVIREVSSDFKVEVSDIHEANGNVLANDTIVSGTKLTGVDGVAVNAAGVTVKGDYGTLIIKADGSYVYKPNADLNNIGKTELFEYTLTDVNGKSTAADLIVQIGTNSGIDLTWDPTDPAKPAVTNLSVSDDVNSAQTTVKKAADVTQSLVCGSAKSVAYYGGQKLDGVSKLAIQSLAEGSTAKIAIKSTLALSQTITGDKFGYQVQYKDSAGNWVNASGAGSSGTVVGSGYHSAGTALFNTSYQANAALSKQWQVVFTTSEANYNLWGTNSTLINTLVQSVISTDKLVSDGVNKAVGNVITDDTGFGADKLASKDDQLFVKNPNTGNFELAKGDVITVASGKLVLNQNGSYEFTPAANSTSAEVKFEYKLVAPNGVEESATLTIDLGKAFVSTSANDTVALGNAADKLIFNVLNATDKTGGNGHDIWTDFKVENNDKIDISKLLQGSVTEQNIDQYVSVKKVGNDTVISIDRDGSGSTFAKADLVTFKNTDTTLQDLLNNNNLLY
ncbi:hypothetical protein AMD27_11660 [Acinetobacter sp. TGL-Y2]|uniref:BapA/Bap/LapF family large adhesin n=1 Tax=Acinetobacter sp. TGL-Y2 TaxID=1407071 RepID=UPI0007A67E64|nr:BapA/Bap/LapF family large adhesin [Acinetobacter sp. TGL-Y2]AMW79475.1 hypothetical protein AMD27_11660 [Acinetobacter sp. TGL-Y2]